MAEQAGDETIDLRALAMAVAAVPLRLLEIARRVPLVDVAEALVRLPLELERNVRTTNELIEATSSQLAETTVALVRVGDTLQEVLERVEAVERAGQRLGKLIDRKGS
ncbi:MAG: hypothetical protein ACLGIR_02775 [Actinomycetes bacterium]